MANSAARKASRTETTPDKNFLEERVKYLEAEVKTLNKRLDTLRAAKNNTVIKATTKYVPSSEPKTHDGAAELARKQESEELRNLRLKVKELEGILAKERIMFKTELETFQKLKMEEQVQNTNCERHEALILSLQTENVQLQVQVTIYFSPGSRCQPGPNSKSNSVLGKSKSNTYYVSQYWASLNTSLTSLTSLYL